MFLGWVQRERGRERERVGREGESREGGRWRRRRK